MRKPTKQAVSTKMLKNAGLPALKTPDITRGELMLLRAMEMQEGKITTKQFADELHLTDEMLKYAEYYTSTEHLGDSYTAVIEAYNLDINDREVTAKCNKILKRIEKHQGLTTMINALLHTQGLNESNVDKQLLFCVNQHTDMKVKLMAIKLFKEMNGKLKKEQAMTITHRYDYSAMSLEKKLQLRELMREASIDNQMKTISIQPKNVEDIDAE